MEIGIGQDCREINKSMISLARKKLFNLCIICSLLLGIQATYSQVVTRSAVKSSVTEINQTEWRIALNPKDNWFNTGISIKEGDLLRISSSGTIIWDKESPAGEVTPDGADYTADTLENSSDFPLPSANCGSLIMKIGSSIYALGLESQVRAEESGNIEFMVNDRVQWLNDNTGSFSTKVKIIKPIKHEAEGLTIELLEARLSGGKVTVEMLVTSHEDDRGISASIRGFSYEDNTMLYDDLGNSYKAQRGTFANNPLNSRPWILISEVSTKMTITFEDISPQAKNISSLHIVFWTTWRITPSSTRGAWFGVDFRNVPFSR